MKNVIVLGAGLIGKTIAIDLCKEFDVTSSDIQMNSLSDLSANHQIKIQICNFQDKPELEKLIAPFDFVISAVPGFMGYETLKTIIEAKKNVVDISFFPEDPFQLNELAIRNNVTAIIDCGVAPGMCNILAGHYHKKIKLVGYECLVGGLPVKREWPFEYKAGFSPADVIEEYVRPARYVENGKQITKEALTDIEKITFKETGELESFNSDGLRTLAVTMKDVPNMKEKTLRYPGHAELMKIFRETGLFSKVSIAVNGKNVSPLEITSKLLFPLWKMKQGEKDFTIMRVILESEEEKIIFTLYDLFDDATQTSSMARTTGYTCTAAVRVLVSGLFSKKGICPPEYLGEEENCFEFILNYLTQKKVIYKKEIFKKNITELSKN